MAINYEALSTTQEAEQRAFGRHLPEATDGYSYVPGETVFIDAALPSRESHIYALVLGQNPGASENAARRPFVGPSGVMLRRFLEYVSIPPAWITNTYKYKTPVNRAPSDEEVELAKPYLVREWHAIGKPRCVITLGNTPLKAVTGRAGVLNRAGMMERWQASDGGPIDVWPMVHPSFALKNPGIQPTVEKHWGYLREWLDATYN
jgi:DNA polymerase